MAGSSALRLATRPAGGIAAEQGPAPSPEPPHGIGQFVRRVLGGGAELLVALAITFGFFSVFLLILAMVFPSGLSLETLSTQMRQDQQAGWMSRSGTVRTTMEAGGPVAAISVLQGAVRSKPAHAIAWNPALEGQALHDRDGVQTGAQGRVVIDFDAGSRIVVERNSLIIVSAPAIGPGQPTPVQSVVVLEGEIWARFAGRGARSLSIGETRVEVAAGATTEAATEVHVRVKKDQPSTIAVLSGTVDIASQAGRTRIGPRQFGRVSPDGMVAVPSPLPGEPVPLQPAVASSFAYRDLPPQIEFRWSAVPGAERYRVVVASDRDALRLAVDETVIGESLTWGRLKEGRYVWRISALAGDAEGVPSAWRPLVVAREAVPPTLTVEPLPRTIERSSLRVSGRIDRPASIYVSGKQVATTRGGQFEFEMTLNPGVNVIVVEAADEAGNTAYWSGIVNAKF